MLYHLSCSKEFTSLRALQVIIEKYLAEETVADSPDLEHDKIRPFAVPVQHVYHTILEKPETQYPKYRT